MGFGSLFVGYMFLLAIPLRSMGICVEVLGYFIMLRALSKTVLGQYQTGFLRAHNACYLLLPLGIFSLCLQSLDAIGFHEIYNRVYRATELIYSVLLAVALLVFHYFLYDGVSHQARDVDLPDIVRQSIRNRILTVIYFSLMIAVNFLDIPALTKFLPYENMVGIVSLVGVVWILLNAKMIFNCYMWICLPGDEDMPIREGESNFGLPSLFNIKKKQKPRTPEEQALLDQAEKAKQKAAYDAEMKKRQEERTKKSKRGKKR